MTKLVRALRAGVYGHLREEGDIFEVAEDRHFSKAWMEEVSKNEAAKQRKAEQAVPEAERGVATSTIADNAVIEALKADLAARDAEIDRLKRGKKAPAEPKTASSSDEPEKTPAEVLAMGSDGNVEFMTFKAAARKILGDALPATKAEIIAALEDKATQP
ncbi:hypothetical protein G3A56_09105 [Rhizobium oryzihabitans]|uniref:Uncharacterized protein n=1 Tax=Rhizobium oryzihabitans TaxID=2267833 RepID=A0A7L5BGT9_9HYPH|nr:hypothetical protein [Rhizobium oryzihabitans]QIB38127.1 hypothetical protein G3A56_09105 [Rhizobium oryzihabitans]